MYRALPEQASQFGYGVRAQPEPDHTFEPGGTLTFGDCSFVVRHAPGHAPGHVILVSPEDHLAFVGDVVFQGSIGRSDLPGGDFRTLMRSIREQVLTLPDDMVLYPGHGPDTTVGFERQTNPFLVPSFGGELA
jgi:hydroxyacylglutathione hydrolase